MVTQKENILRGIGPTALNAKKTHCSFGHEFTVKNIYYGKGKNTGRQCRACRNRIRIIGRRKQKERIRNGKTN